MKLSEKIKRIPKDKLIIGITLIVLIIVTVAIIAICSFIPPKDDTSVPPDDDDLVVGVFNELTDTSAQTDITSESESDTTEPQGASTLR